MTKKKIFIEARINEYVMRDRNPNIPWLEDEIVQDAVRCREKGASILHYHARNADGSPNNDIEANARVIRKIRKNTDIVIHVTLGFGSNDETPKRRIDNIVALCSEPTGRPDIVPIDPGTLNLECYDAAAGKVENADKIYLNTTATNMMAAEAFSRLDLTVQFFCWGQTFVRRGRMLMDLGLVKRRPYFVFHLTSGTNISSNLPTELSIRSLLEAMPGDKNVPWAVACGGCDLFRLIPFIARSGGHLEIGLGDYTYPELGTPTNAQLVERAAAMAVENGREIATVAETRELMGMR